jgi:hypothetical protein
MPLVPDAAGLVIAEAEEVVRRAAEREEARARRKARNADRQRCRGEERGRNRAEQRERQRTEQERLRAEAERARAVPADRAAELRAACGVSVPDCFAAVPDPRGRRGRRHSLPSVLTLVLMAVLRGRTTLAGITTWIAHASQDQLAAAGARTGACGQRQPPSGRTVTRLLGMVGGRPLAEAVACYLAAAEAAEPPAYPVAGPALQPHLACDGKEVRGAVRPDGTSLFLLSAATGGIVVADREIPAKTSEIPEIGPMLLELDQRFPLAGWVLTADALCGRPHNWSYAGMVVMPMPPPGAMPAVVAARTAAA